MESVNGVNGLLNQNCRLSRVRQRAACIAASKFCDWLSLLAMLLQGVPPPSNVDILCKLRPRRLSCSWAMATISPPWADDTMYVPDPAMIIDNRYVIVCRGLVCATVHIEEVEVGHM